MLGVAVQSILAVRAGLFALSLLLVLLIAFAQGQGWLTGINHGAMHAVGLMRLHHWAIMLTPAMIALSEIGGTIARFLLIGCAMGLLVWAGRKAAALWLLATCVGGTLLNTLLHLRAASTRSRKAKRWLTVECGASFA